MSTRARVALGQKTEGTEPEPCTMNYLVEGNLRQNYRTYRAPSAS